MHGYPTVTYISTDDRGLPDAPPLPRRRRWRSRLPSLPTPWPTPIVRSTADFTAAIAIAAAAVSAAAITHYPSRYPIQCPSPQLILRRCSAAVSAAIVTALPSPLLANCCQPRCGCIHRPSLPFGLDSASCGRTAAAEAAVWRLSRGPHRAGGRRALYAPPGRADCTKCGPTPPHVHKGPGRADSEAAATDNDADAAVDAATAATAADLAVACGPDRSASATSAFVAVTRAAAASAASWPPLRWLLQGLPPPQRRRRQQRWERRWRRRWRPPSDGDSGGDGGAVTAAAAVAALVGAASH
jgi:hypothetical protein